MSATPINKPTWQTQTVTCTLVNTAYQGPSIVVDDGYALVVRYRRPLVGNPTGYVAPSAVLVLLSAFRNELRGGEVLNLYIQNANAVFVASDTALMLFEFTTEQ